MQSTDALRRRIKTAEDLLSVVKTMKTLAAVNLRHYEQAVAALTAYSRTIELGLQGLLHAAPDHRLIAAEADAGYSGLIVFGTDQGLCGQFNERVVGAAQARLTADPPRRELIATMGERCAGLLEDGGCRPAHCFSVPAGSAGIDGLVADLLVLLDAWRADAGLQRLVLVHNRPVGAAWYATVTTPLLPLDRTWLQGIAASPWQARGLPTITMTPEALFSTLVRHYLFVMLYRTVAESLAAEDASRLAAMQHAEHNIEERLGALQVAYHHHRQNRINAELLDIVAGYEAVTAEDE